MTALPPSHRAGGPILPLREIAAGDLPRIGPKAYHLGLLAQAGFPVADGFCITTDALSGLTGEDARLPGWLAEAVIDAYRRARFGLVAVRSSALDEDRPEASGAGVYASTLNVGDETALIAAVETCLRSRHGQVARLYRRRCQERPAPMAVLVQAQVEAEAAGVMFTADPITRLPGKVHVNAVWGLGEPLAAGRVSGDLFVAAPNGRLRSRRIAPKTTMLTGLGEQPVPPEKTGQPALSPAQIGDLVRLGQAVEAKFGRPQDIEFAIDQGRPVLIQARPIPGQACRDEADAMAAYLAQERRRLTAHLEGLRRRGRLQGSETVLSNGNIGELLPAPTPMSFGLFREVFAGVGGAIARGRRRLGYGVERDCAEHLFELVCGQPYFNLEIDARCYDIGLPLDLDGLLAEVVSHPESANYPELGLYARKLEAALPTGEARRSQFHAHLHRRCQRFVQRVENSLLPALEAERLRASQAYPAEASDAELLQAFQVRLDRLRRRIGVPFVMAARLGFYFADQVRQRLQRLLGPAAQDWYPLLLQGLPGSRITQQAIDLERLAAGEMSLPAFLAGYGSLAANELEISTPRLAENQAMVAQLLDDLKSSGRSPGDDFARQRSQRGLWETRLAIQLRGKPEAAALFADLRAAQACLPLRETIKFHLAAEYALLRRLLRQLEARLPCPADSLFYLFPDELPQCLDFPPALGDLIEGRRRERQLAQRLLQQKRMPAVLFGSRLEAMGELPECSAAQTHGGIAVSPGEAVGPVRLVDGDDIDVVRLLGDFKGGEILVARSANLGLSPLFRVTAGLVVEVGGVLAHSACQAREAGIPAIVLDNATLILRNGDMVRINGSKGSIELLQRAGEGHCP